MTILLQGSFVICWLGLAKVNLPTKFEIFISSHYEDIKCDAKCVGKWGGLGQQGVTQCYWK